MAAVAVEPVVAAVTAAITAAVEKGTEAAVVAAISAAVTEVVEAAVTSAISAAIASGIASAVSGSITAITTKAVEDALQKDLDKAVKDVIGSQGLNDLSEAMTAIPSDVVVDKLAKEAIDSIKPHLWVFTDLTFLKLTRLIRTLRIIQKGETPEDDDDDDDDDCDEEKCRFFTGPKVADNSEDFLFFTVFGSQECKEGDEVYSMSAQWKKLKSLVDDPIGGHFVNQLFQELFESCAEDVEEGDVDSPLVAGVANLKLTGPKKVAKVAYGTLVLFANETVYNIKGSAKDKRKSNWLKEYFVLGYGKCGKCYIQSENPVCGHTNPQKGNIVGGHMWSPALKKADKSLYYYILPICKRHNKRVVYDKPRSDGAGWLKTTPDASAMKITSTSKVEGWKELSSYLKGTKTLMMMAASNEGETAECHEITQPQQLTDWLLEEVHKIALEFAKGPIETVFNEVSATALGKLNEIIKSAGDEAKHWTKKEGHKIMRQSLIPFYGIYKATKGLSSLKKNAIRKFHSGARSALSSYKKECLGDEEQKRREKRLIEETDKVIASNEWKERIVAFEGTVASKVPTLIKP